MEKSQKTIIDHIPDFLDWIDVEKGLSNKTQENYGRFLKKFSSWLENNRLSHLKPHEFDSSHIWQYRVSLARSIDKNGRTLKKVTQNYYLIALRAMFNFFAARDIESLPSEKIELAKQKKDKKINFLKLEQVSKLLQGPNTATFMGLRDRTIIEVLFSTGLRISELTSLNRNQFRDDRLDQSIELGIVGKGSYPRTVYFSARSVRWLKKYLEVRDKLTGPNQAMDGPLFINQKSPRVKIGRLTDRSVENIIKKYVLRAGLPMSTTPHTLRHSFATDLLNQGADLRTVQEFLGHQNIATTQIYTHVTNKRLKELHQKFHGGEGLKE